MVKDNRSLLRMRIFHPIIDILCLILLSFLLSSDVALAQINTWVKKTSNPRPGCSLHSIALLNGKIYVMGGYSNYLLSTVDEYDPITEKWTTKANLPEARNGASNVVFDGKIYVFGGWIDVPPYHPLSRIDVYDPTTDKWTTEGDMPVARGLNAAVEVNGKVYIIGGYDNSIQGTSRVDEYDLITRKWARKADMPTKRIPHYYSNISCAVNGKIYIIGGAIGFPQAPISIVEEYDPATDTWTRKADMPTPRWAFGITVVNGKIFVIGGGGIRENDWSIPTMPTVEMYDPVTDKWTRKADMPALQWGLSAIPIGAYIYAIGWSEIEVYDTGLGMEINAISLREGANAGGEDIAISGSSFLPDTIVTIGDKRIENLKVTDSMITGKTPPGADREYDIKFYVPSYDYSCVVGKFIYRPISNITISKITPDNGKQAGGNIINVIGNGFIQGATVTVDGNMGTDFIVTPNLISFKVPKGTEGKKSIVVTNPDGNKAILMDGYRYNPFPVIDRVIPAYGGPLERATRITVEGENFMEGLDVYVGDERILTLGFFSEIELRFFSPKSKEVGIKPVRVVNPDGQEAILEKGFKYNNAPYIGSVSPKMGALEGGTWVTISGGYFDVFEVYVDDALARIVRSNEESIIIETPASSAGVKRIKVVNKDGQYDIEEDAFTYNPGPFISTVTPNNGRLSGGTKITLIGNGFMPEAKIVIGIFGDDPNSIATTMPIWSWDYVSPIEMTGLMPLKDRPGKVSLMVINPDDQRMILRDCFTYNPLPTITGVSPEYGPSSGGTKLTIRGTGFFPDSRVIIGFYQAKATVLNDELIEAITPIGTGISAITIINPDTQTVIKRDGFRYIGRLAYNYPNPFHAGEETTFRFITKDAIERMEVRIFNTGGIPIDAVYGTGSNEVKWKNSSLYPGIYVYRIDVNLQDGKKDHFQGVLEVMK